MKNCSIIKVILQMTYEGFSNREIGSRCQCGHGTVSRIQNRWKETGKTADDLEQISESDLLAIIYPSSAQEPRKPLPDFEKIYEALSSKENKRDLYFFWERYRLLYPDGYMYTQFCMYYRRYVREHHPASMVTMRLNRTPGEIVYIDWAGDAMDLVYAEDGSGRLLTAHFFVTTVGYSSMLFVKAMPDEKTESFCTGTADALAYYGALPRILKPDNTKAAVISHGKDEIVLNATYQDLEEYYGVHVVPAPPRKPKGKATVENAVNWVERKVMERLRGRTYSSFETLNKEILQIVDQLNDKKKKGENKSRRQLFNEIDFPKMRPLEVMPFRPAAVRFASVSHDYHIKYEDHYYSVPYKYFGTQVILRADSESVWVTTIDNREIARHRRAGISDPKYITENEHMPPAHQFYDGINRHDSSYYLRWASDIGPNMERYIEIVLSKGTNPEQNYRTCMAILQESKKDRRKAEEVAQEGLKMNHIGQSYFKAGMRQKEQKTKTDRPSIRNSNTRGKDYYGKI